jgi:hypothetical protein
LNLFNTFTTPLIYTPGDNEWLDCQKSAEGGGSTNSYQSGDPYANLDTVRSMFFSQPGKSLGTNPITVHSQAIDD